MALFMCLFLMSCEKVELLKEKAMAVIAAHMSEVQPLEVKGNLAWWKASLSGKEEDYAEKEKIQNQLDAVLSNPNRFEDIKKLNQAKVLADKYPLVARQIRVLYNMYQPAQVDPQLLKQINAKSNAIEQAFNVFRANIDGKEYTTNEIVEVLKKSNDSRERQRAWESSKEVGKKIEKDLLELVRLRNQSARSLGYSNYHQMMLALGEQDQKKVIQLFDELDQLTAPLFAETKKEIDERLAKKYQVKESDLMPWHYQDLFFQEVPAVFDYNPDEVYSTADIIKLTTDFYNSIGLPIDDVLKNSSLYEQPGKTSHAFMTDIDRKGDVRVILNIKPTQYWMSTSLHEFGHSVYSSKNIPETMPYLLRSESHVLTTEGLAMMFQRLVRKSEWLKQMGVHVADPEGVDQAEKKMQRAELLIFSRWTQVMLRFEKAMYENPDQDLNVVWWDLVEKYQGLKRPAGRNAPDYATKIHIVSAPCYYHNYEMGELFASQVHHTIAKKVLKQTPAKAVYVNHPEVGKFLKTKVFAPGKSLDWNALTRFATGSELNSKAFAKDLK